MNLGKIGKYEKLDILGHGVSGIVYLAWDTLLRRQVALKELSLQSGDEARFLEEARLLDRLRHPNIVRVNSVDKIDGHLIMDMEYVKGTNLHEHMRRAGRLPVREALTIAVQICDALDFAHQHHTIHRDVKPANVFITNSGTAKLGDFGLAEILGSGSYAGGAGTYAYMSPEDFEEGETSDHRSDIWALGVTLYEMLAGERPFRAVKPKDPFSWKRAVEKDAPTPLSQIDHTLPSALDSVISHALAKDKRERYQSASDMRADLAQIVSSLGGVASLSGMADRSTKAKRVSARTSHTRDVRTARTEPKPRVALPVVAVLLAVATAAAYWPVFANGYVFDDVPYLVENPNLRDGFTADAVRWAFTSFRCANWHPLTWLSAMLDVSLFGLNPAGHHVVNLLLHLANTVLLMLLLRRVTGSLWKSAFVAGLFALHPLHVESVAWLAERKDVLSTLFWLLAIWAYARYAEKPSVRRYAVLAVIFALGLMAKPMLVTLPIVLILLDFWPLRRLSLGESAKKGGPTPAKLILEKTPLLALSAASSVITFLAQQSIGAVVQLQKFPIGLRIENALVSCVAYIWKMIWPAGLAAYYPYPAHGIPAWQALGAALVLVGVSVFILRRAKSRPYLAVGWLWYLITLIPVIGIVQVGEQSMADRYTYVPLIGIFLMIAWGVPDASGRSRTTQSPILPFTHSPILLGIAVVILAALGVCTSLQARYWQSDYTLFLRAANVTSENKLARNNLGVQLEAQGKLDEAIVQYRKALEIDPNYADARLDLGNALFSQGKVEEASKEYSAVLKSDPGNQKASIGLANALAKTGRGDVAASEYSRILESDPNNADAHYNLGLMLCRQGKLDEAAEHYRKALDINPNYAKAHNNMGTLLTQQNKPDEALPHYREAIRIKPDYAEAHCNLGIVLAGQGNVPEAAQHFLAAVRIKPDYAEAHASLALAYFLTERYAEAWKELRLTERYGIPPDPRFLQALSEKMPEP